jgi:hypothetical protein
MKKPTTWQLACLLGTLGLLAATQPVAGRPQDGSRPAASATLVPPGQEQLTPAQRTETQTLTQGLVQRLSGEADSTFLRRVLPVSYPTSYQRLTYAWRPSTFGKQLFFTVTGTGPELYLSFLFVLDPFQANKYTVQRLALVV